MQARLENCRHRVDTGFQFATLKKYFVWNNFQFLKCCRNKEIKEVTQISPISYLFLLFGLLLELFSLIFLSSQPVFFPISCLWHGLLLLSTSVYFPGIRIFSYITAVQLPTSWIYIDKILWSSHCPHSRFISSLNTVLQHFSPPLGQNPVQGQVLQSVDICLSPLIWNTNTVFVFLWPWHFLRNTLRPPPLTF